MADNINVTEGTGRTIRADEVGSALLQVIKLGLGADGVEDCLVDSGQQAMASSVPIVIASDQTAIPTGKTRVFVAPTLTNGAAAYSALDVLCGPQTLTGALRTSGGTAELESIIVRDTSDVRPAIFLLIFDASFTGTYTDNGSSALNAADIPKICRAIMIPTSAYNTIGVTGVADINVSQAVKASSGTSLYALAIVTGTPTLTANCISITYVFNQD